MEIKSSYTPAADHLNNVSYFVALQKNQRKHEPRGESIYCGDKSLAYKAFAIKSWSEV